MLTRCGLAEQDIGVVSLYRQQLKLIQQHLRDKPGIELLTADKSQGRDKECIMISMVRSNADGFVSIFLNANAHILTRTHRPESC
jgi:DNA replication ATP-dependent helicase Dna2